MATELEIRKRLDTMRSLPLRLEKLASSIGTTQWPGQPVRLDLPTGVVLSAEDRAGASARVRELGEIITGSNLTPKEIAKARLALLTRMLLAMPMGGSSSEAAAEARADMYDDALSDIPPWAIDAAIKRWIKGEVPELRMGSLNFTFAPAPAILRKICKLELQPYEDQSLKLTRLLAAIPIERAMDPSPIAPEAKSESDRVVRIGMRRI
jgi:hypothetical protein